MLNTKVYLYVGLLISSYSVQAAPQCDRWIAKTLSAQGQVEKQQRNQKQWQPVNQVEFFCHGDKIRTLDQSRVILKFVNEPKTVIELQQNSALTFPKIETNPTLPFIQLKDGKLILASAIRTLKLRLLLI